RDHCRSRSEATSSPRPPNTATPASSQCMCLDEPRSTYAAISIANNPASSSTRSGDHLAGCSLERWCSLTVDLHITGAGVQLELDAAASRSVVAEVLHGLVLDRALHFLVEAPGGARVGRAVRDHVHGVRHPDGEVAVLGAQDGARPFLVGEVDLGQVEHEVPGPGLVARGDAADGGRLQLPVA